MISSKAVSHHSVAYSINNMYNYKMKRKRSPWVVLSDQTTKDRRLPGYQGSVIRRMSLSSFVPLLHPPPQNHSLVFCELTDFPREMRRTPSRDSVCVCRGVDSNQLPTIWHMPSSPVPPRPTGRPTAPGAPAGPGEWARGSYGGRTRRTSSGRPRSSSSP